MVSVGESKSGSLTAQNKKAFFFFLIMKTRQILEGDQNKFFFCAHSFVFIFVHVFTLHL